MSNQRQEWEYATGRQVGDDLPITSEPRPEERPGVPIRPRSEKPAESDPGGQERGERSEVRAVEVADPRLSPDANARLTEELREVVGDEPVRVPADRPRPSQGESVPDEGVFAYISTHRPLVFGSLAGALTIAAVVALATGVWWFLPLAAGLHALGTMTVWMTVIKMTTVTEHASPTLAATLEDEGVSNPDERFSELVEEFSADQRRDAAEVYTPGAEGREVPAGRDPGRAAGEQSSAITPTAGPSEPAQGGGTPDFLIWGVGLALFVVSIVIPILAGGGAMWFLTAVMIPLLAGWMLLQREMAVHGGQLHLRGRGPATAIVVLTVVAVAAFCAVVALAFA
jgi:hypothetical protein